MKPTKGFPGRGLRLAMAIAGTVELAAVGFGAVCAEPVKIRVS